MRSGRVRAIAGGNLGACAGAGEGDRGRGWASTSTACVVWAWALWTTTRTRGRRRRRWRMRRRDEGDSLQKENSPGLPSAPERWECPPPNPDSPSHARSNTQVVGPLFPHMQANLTVTVCALSSTPGRRGSAILYPQQIIHFPSSTPPKLNQRPFLLLAKFLVSTLSLFSRASATRFNLPS